MFNRPPKPPEAITGLTDGELAMIANAVTFQVDFWKRAKAQKTAPEAMAIQQIDAWRKLLEKIEGE